MDCTVRYVVVVALYMSTGEGKFGVSSIVVGWLVSWLVCWLVGGGHCGRVEWVLVHSCCFETPY